MRDESDDRYRSESFFGADFTHGIDVDLFIARYGVEHPRVREVLEKYPPLCYLLGSVRPAFEDSGERITDARPDDVFRPVSYLTQGSGMFGLTNQQDAMRWRGIFNHIMGTSRQVYYLADRLSQLTPKVVRKFADMGFDVSTFEGIEPVLLRDFMFTSHAGRRQMDEYRWHDVGDSAHPSDDSGHDTRMILQSEKADPRFLELIRVETHVQHLVRNTIDSRMLPDLVDNVLTYPDWTFGQEPITLDKRFAVLSQAGRAASETLEVLKPCGKTFEHALQMIVSPNIFDEMTQAGPYEWETEIREAYCAPSGISMADTFPGYISG